MSNALIDDLNARAREQVALGIQISEQIEIGHAQQPMSERFRALGRPLDGALLALGLNTGPRDLQRLLALLGGAPLEALAPALRAGIETIEIVLGGAGLAVAIDDGAPEPCQSPDHCARRLAQAGEARRLRISVPTTPQRAHLVLRLIDPAALAARPALIGRHGAEAQVFLDAGLAGLPADADAGEIAEIAADLARAVDVVQPIAWPGDSVARAAATLVLPPIAVGEDAKLTALPRYLADPADPLRIGLGLKHRSRQTLQLARALGQQVEREQRQAATLKAKEDRVSKGLDDQAGARDLRGEMDRLKRLVGDELRRLSDERQEANRQVMLPQGSINLPLREATDRLSVGDLRREDMAAAIKLTIDPGFLQQLSSLCEDLLRQQMQIDIGELASGLRSLTARLSQELEAYRGEPLELDLRPPGEGELWQRMTEMVSLNIGYRGEMPKRGLLQRLGEGRRVVFTIMMFGSLLLGYGAARELRYAKYFVVVILLLFVGGIVYTFVSWKKQDAARLAREADRVRQSLGGEVGRLVDAIQREKVKRLQDHLEDLRRTLERRMDTIQRQTQESIGEDVRRQREDLRSRQRAGEQRLRDAGGLSQRIEALLRDCAALEASCVAAARQIGGQVGAPSGTPSGAPSGASIGAPIGTRS